MSERWLKGLTQTSLSGPVLLIARLFMATLMVVYGANELTRIPEIQAVMREANAAVPANLVYLAVVVEIGGGALVAIGYQARMAALCLAAYSILATGLFTADQVHFSVTKDFAIAGGFLLLAAHGPGSFSLDAFLDARESSPRSLRRWVQPPHGLSSILYRVGIALIVGFAATWSVMLILDGIGLRKFRLGYSLAFALLGLPGAIAHVLSYLCASTDMSQDRQSSGRAPEV